MVAAEVAKVDDQATLADKAFNCDLGFLPNALTAQCENLIESYHELHGYSCLPDILWKARLGPFIESHRLLGQLLRKASTTRSAKKSNNGFVQIAKAILSLEVLASSFAGWSALYPESGSKACAILRRTGRGPQMPLMEFYLNPPKHVSSAHAGALALPSDRSSSEAELPRPSKSELTGKKQGANNVDVVVQPA
jgi:hypothetical protein